MSQWESNATGDCCKLAHYATSVGSTAALLPPRSEQRACRLQTQQPHPSPPTAPTPPFPRKHPQSLLYFFCIGYLLVIDSQSRCCHSCITFPFLRCSYDICLSLYHSTNSSNKTGPNEKNKNKNKDEAQISVYYKISIWVTLSYT